MLFMWLRYEILSKEQHFSRKIPSGGREGTGPVPDGGGSGKTVRGGTASRAAADRNTAIRTVRRAPRSY